MRILVTGGAGYIGSVLVPALLESGHDVWGRDRLAHGCESLVSAFSNEGFDLYGADVRDEISVREAREGVVHLTAVS
ncbi:NAD(P)-dependent oxidoreductase [Myxococcota bacterium]|nr:NAD(P)-dependent oxidoreductase [Myxococcota bacterium]